MYYDLRWSRLHRGSAHRDGNNAVRSTIEQLTRVVNTKSVLSGEVREVSGDRVNRTMGILQIQSSEEKQSIANLKTRM